MHGSPHCGWVTNRMVPLKNKMWIKVYKSKETALAGLNNRLKSSDPQ